MAFFTFKKKQDQNASQSKTDELSMLDNSGMPPSEAAIQRWLLVLQSSPTDINAKIQIVQLSITHNEIAHGDQMVALLERDHSKSVASKIIQARWQQHKENYDEARTLWSEVDKLKPGSIESLANLAHIDLAENKLDTAWKRADEIINTLPEEHVHKGYIIHARVHSKREDLAAEVESWQQVLAHTDNHLAAEINYTSGLYKLGRFTEILERIDGALEKYNGNEKLQEFKCECLIKTDQIEAALEANLTVGDKSRNQTGTLYQRAMLQFRVERLDDAEISCKKILAQDPTHIKTLTLFARIGQMKANAA